MSSSGIKAFLPRPQAARRYHRSNRTMARWVTDPKLGFPKPIVINGRWFFNIEELEEWELSRASTPGPRA